jgi:amino acid adenylation domain-containing protein/thioester reductase-like protein
VSEENPVDVASPEDLYRLSPVQKGMLFHVLSAPGSGVYFEQFTTAYDDGLDPDIFAAAWRLVLDRHPVLRTSFLWEDLEEPVQVVHRQAELELERLDWRHHDPDEQRRGIAALAAADRRRGFDLARPPLLRLSLVRVGERAWRVIWSYHHLLLDGWSAGLVMHEVAALYQAVARGETATLPARRPFKAYILWLLQQDPAATGPYWRRVLAGFRQPTPLVVDTVAAAGVDPGNSGYELRLTRLSADLTARLKGFARRHRLTLSTLVHGAWALLLARYSGEADVVFGTTVSGRPPALPGVESMIGCFINTLPVRVAATPESELVPWLQGLQKGLVELRQHEHTPLLDVLGWAEVPRHLPLFESILVFESFTAESSFAMSHSGVFQRTNYPLTLAVSPTQELVLRLGFEPGRFPAGTVPRMLSHLESLLAGMPDGADRPLRTLPLLPPAQRAQMLAEWNDTRALPPRPVGLHQPFEDQARRCPEAPALFFEGEVWTYGELNRRANRLAHHLRALGLPAGGLVGVYMERSCEMVRAVVAILKAGGAFVPLETSWPVERVRYILESQGISHVVADGERAALLREPPALPRLAHVVGPEPFAEMPATDPPAVAGPESLAYIIFTSGSTGRPKGVMVAHRPAVHLIDWVNRTFAIGPADRLLFVAALAFDLSIYDIFGILAAGAGVRIASPRELADPEALVGILCREPVTFWDSAPAALNRLAPYFPPRGPSRPALRLVFLSGDWIPVPLPDRVRDAFPDARVIALGGGTEATIWSNFYPVGEVDPSWPSIPYGRPITNARYHVLDADLQPCPIGVPGDLYIGGDCCLCIGYAGEPTLTAQQFLPAAVGDEPGARLYRPGDRTRYLPDGNLEFLGRLDTQVKVRGFRIELGEIEAVLSAHPAVRETVVVVREDRPGDQRLVAYVIFREEQEENAAAVASLREHLRTRLPEPMVPGLFVRMNSWPITANGKLDRRALPAPEQAGEGGAGPKLAPRTESERAIAEIWGQVLGVDAVGVEDDFHELGGHSLLLVQMAGKVRERLGRELPLAYLLPHRTVASLAQAVDEGLRQPPAPESPAVLEAGLRADAVLDPALAPAAPPAAGALDPRAVFLTGGTGFLGAYLLAELLRQSAATVFCLVRAADPPAGIAKLRRELESYGLWEPAFAPRLTAVPGDLSQPLLGLSEEDFTRLSASVEAIYHNGALVDFLSPYAALKAANVLGTVEVLRLACRGAAKPLHHVSTLGVLDSAAYAAAGVAREDTPLADCAGLAGGYAQSKWVAEMLIRSAGDRGLPVAIYRPGTISGDSRSGQANLKDFANSLIKGSIQLGAVPRADGAVNLAPVDFVGRAIVWLSRRRESLGKTFHLVNPQPIAAPVLFAWIRDVGYPLDEIPPETWREMLIRRLGGGEENALAPFLPLFEAAAARALRGGQAPVSQIRYDSGLTFLALARGPVLCPPVEELLEVYFSYFVRSGFLVAPDAERQHRSRVTPTPAGPRGQEERMSASPAVDESAGAPFPGCFVLSLPRTGSTLLRLLLDSHPQIYCPDELNLGRLVHALASTQEGLTDCPDPSAPTMADINPAGAAAIATRRILADMLAGAAAARGKTRWCDKSPANLVHIPVIDRVFPNARYLLLHRHALDFVMSCVRFSTYGFFLTVVEEYVRKDHWNFVRALLQAWNDKTAELLEFERLHPDRCYRLRYEDLVSDPAATLERICDFLAVERVPDLATRAFSSPHQQRAYHGDPKAYYSSGIADSSVGSGAEVSLGALRLVPADQIARMNELLTALAYPAAEISASGIDLHMGRKQSPAPEGGPPSQAPGELFALLGQRLLARSAPASIAGTAFTFVLTGEAGGAWTVDLAQTPAQVVSGSDSAPCTLTLTASDFADVVTGRLNPALAFQEGKLKLAGAADAGMLRDLLALLLAP